MKQFKSSIPILCSKVDRNNLHASVRQRASPSDLFFSLFFSLSCLPQDLMLEYFHFSTAESLYDDE